MSDFSPWDLNTYHCDGELPWQDENYGVPLQVGDGFIDASHDYRRFRVIDIWFSTDRHSPFDYGRHVFLEDVSRTDDDRPHATEPSYFSS